MRRKNNEDLISTITFAGAPTDNYFNIRLGHLSALANAINAEARAYKNLIIKIQALAKKKSLDESETRFLSAAKSIINAWHLSNHQEILSLCLTLKDYIQSRLHEQLAQFNADTATKKNIETRIQKILENLFKGITETLNNASDIDRIDLSPIPNSNQNSPIRLRDDLKLILQNIRFNEIERKNLFNNLTNDRLKDITNNNRDSIAVNFDGRKVVGNKNGGANSAGHLGGVYENISTGKRSLIKKEDAIEKVIGEYLAGKILSAIYHEIRVPNTRYAKINLIRPKDANINNISGDDVYIESEFIPNYKADLWDAAWDSNKRPNKPNKRIPGILDKETLVWTDDFIKQHKLEREFAKLTAPRILFDFGLHNGNLGDVIDEDGSHHLAAFDYGAAFDNINNPLKPYAQRKIYKNHFLDYGDDINASRHMAEIFIQVGKIKSDIINHEIDSGLDEVCKHFDAEALRKFAKRLGIPNYIFFGINGTSTVARGFSYFVSGLKSAVEFLGVPNSILYPTPSTETAKRRIARFMKEKLRERQESLKNQGFGLALEHCVKIKNGHAEVDMEALRGLINLYGNDLINYLNGNAFEKYHLVHHKALTGVVKFVYDHKVIPGKFNPLKVIQQLSETPIKDALKEAAIQIRKTPIIPGSSSESSDEESSSIYRKKIGFLRRNLNQILALTLTWTLAGAGIGIALGLFTTGGAASALLGVIFGMWGAIAGFTIGCITCAIKEGISNDSPAPERRNKPSMALTESFISHDHTSVNARRPALDNNDTASATDPKVANQDLASTKNYKPDSIMGTRIHGVFLAQRPAPNNNDAPCIDAPGSSL